MQTMVVNKEKQDLRKNLLAKLLILTQSEIKRRSCNVANVLSNLLEYKNAKVVMGYFSLKGEVNLWDMFRKAWGLKKFCFPVMDLEKKDLRVYAVNNLDDGFVRGPYGVSEPDQQKGQEVLVQEIDLVIVPGLAFDKHKNRLGRGAGFYDRFLKQIKPPTVKVGVGFDFQVLDSLPIQYPFDEPVDLVVSEQSFI